MSVDHLEKYKKKRNFESTKEPAESTKSSGNIYVIQKHRATRLHYDFRLEYGGVLLSWAVTKEPSTDTKVKRLAIHVEDHPVDYATFEGIIPEGNYGAGSVEIWDHGTWEPRVDVDEGMEKGELKFTLHGEKLQGHWVLVRMGEKSEKKENWLLIKELHDDDDNKPPSGGAQWNEKSPASPQLCELRTDLPEGSEWRYEVKWDGYRALLYSENGDLKFISRNGNEIKVPELLKRLAPKFHQTAVLDGELVVLNSKGISDFGMLQKSFKLGGKDTTFVAFDLLRREDTDLRAIPLRERIHFLEKIVHEVSSDSLILSPKLEGGGNSVHKTACKVGLEGVVAKNLNSVYMGRRTSDWIKVKCRQQDEGFVVGFTKLQDHDNAIGSLLLASNDTKGFRYIGRIGTGFNNTQRTSILKDLSPLLVKELPVMGLTKSQSKGVEWTDPKFIAQYEYAEITSDGIIRQGSFKGLSTESTNTLPKKDQAKIEKPATKPEKRKEPAKQSKSESKQQTNVKLSHPDKMLDTENNITKQQVFDYYSSIGSRLMPHLKDRFVAMVRCPDGLSGEHFFQKHLSNGHFSSLKDVADGENMYLVVPNMEAVLECAQMGVVEFHPWGSKLDNIEKPDYLTFDLDPAPDVQWDQLLDAVAVVKSRLESIKLNPYLKLSGGKGVHLVLSIKPELAWPEVKSFCKSFAEQVSKEFPKKFLSVMSKKQREGKVFVDYLRNGRGATAVSAYSLRARPGFPVSIPITWEDCQKTTSSNDVNLLNIAEYLKSEKSDPWAGFGKSPDSLKQILKL